MWTKYYSKALGMKYAVNSETGEIMTEDKVVYSKKDLDEIMRKGKITKEMHEKYKFEYFLRKGELTKGMSEVEKLKYFFNGEIIENKKIFELKEDNFEQGELL